MLYDIPTNYIINFYYYLVKISYKKCPENVAPIKHVAGLVNKWGWKKKDEWNGGAEGQGMHIATDGLADV